MRAFIQMQKLSSYLYPNRINVVADLSLYPVRWNIVYQNRVKIYQGVDNVLTLDVKNADQKRIDISSMDIRMSIFDVTGKNIFDDLLTTDTYITAEPGEIQGLATVNISADMLTNITPQFLTFSLYRVNEDDSKTILYADTQFGAKGNMELVGSALSVATPPRYITVFNPITNSLPPYITTYYSDAVEARMPNQTISETLASISLEFSLSGLAGDITVEYTEHDVISSLVTWQALETFSVASSTAALTKTYDYPDYNRTVAWIRVSYLRATNNTGKIDNIVIRL